MARLCTHFTFAVIVVLSVVGVTEPLPNLATQINDEIVACERRYGDALQHAREAGRLLIAAKAELAHGEWLPWLEANIHVTHATSWRYMKLAEGWDALLASPNIARVQYFNDSIRGALKQLKQANEPPTAEEEVPGEPSLLPEWDDETRRKTNRAYDLLYEAAIALDSARTDPTSNGLQTAAALARRAAALLEQLSAQ